MPISRKESPATGLVYLSSSPTAAPARLVLCIPGLGALSTDYLPLLQALENEHSRILFVAPDLPGQGDSPPFLGSEYTFSELAGLLGRLCVELGDASIDKVIIGHSMGCRLALETFSQNPDTVSAVILLDGNWNGPEPPAIQTQELPPKDVQIQYVLHNLETTFGPHTPEHFKQKYRELFSKPDLDYLARGMIENRRWDAERMISTLQKIKTVHEGHHPINLLLVQATDGKGSSRRSLNKWEETAWMKLVRENTGQAYSSLIIEQSGHTPQVDKTSEVAEGVGPLIAI